MVRYRPDVDGLRAVAVLSVLLFHAGVRGVYGGFVGVDVFFVISGYLITGIIQGGLGRDGFSIAEFYKRRVHRIFPALLVVMLATTAAAVWALLPVELVRFGRSLAATALFSSNMLFYSETGYFDAEAAVKPLLHTWSLAIEEQYYIFWPLLLIAAHRLKWSARWMAAGLALASLLFSVWQIKADPSGDFYLLPSRAWELLLGGLLALDAIPPLRARALREAAAAVGLLMILASVKFITAATPFPGLTALLPCVGTALVIHAGREGPTGAGRLLSLGPMRGLGLISYSLYLWHWPVIVFAKIGLFLPPTPRVQLGIIGVSIALAIVSWALVEQPFQRLRPSTPRRTSLAVAGAVIFLICAGGAALATAQGLPTRFTPAQDRIASFIAYDGDAKYRGGTCFLSKPSDRFDAGVCLRAAPGQPPVLLVGDSHAADLWPGLASEGRGFSLLQATSAGCKPLLGRQPGALARCTALMDQVFARDLLRLRPAAVVIAARWREVDLPRLPAVLARLKAGAGEVVLVGPAPQYVTALPRLLVAADRRQDPDLPARNQDLEPLAVDRELRPIAAAAGVRYVSLRDAMCTPDCRTLATPGVPMQFDYGHFTVEGSRAVAPEILQALDVPGRPSAR